MADKEFQEEDVWDVVKERALEPNSKLNKPYKINKKSSSSSSCVLTSHDGARMIPRCCNEAKVSISSHKQQQSSAPMSIPDWSKIYKKGPSDHRYYDDDNDNDDSEIVPPHEYIARRLAITSSMCEGGGWTLKGRDLSKLRNAILRKTGFLE
ncbi:protein S40-6-like [Bidens hawaiensis]|uniref:protein S40-6-like n=1 Tax=Bidens hawaiensis TaxID=980011 RepID=UPI00404A07CD